MEKQQSERKTEMLMQLCGELETLLRQTGEIIRDDPESAGEILLQKDE